MIRPPLDCPARPALALLALASLAVCSHARAADPTPVAPQGRTHQLGWLCVQVSDARVSQVSAYNKDAPDLSIWVPKRRFYVEAADSPDKGARICVPTIIKLGDEALPPDTLVFEKVVVGAGVAHPSQAELVITPEDPRLGEVTLSVVGVAEQWAQRDNVWTFSVSSPANFPERPVRGLIGDGDGPAPSEVFQAEPQMLRFTEPCQPAELEEATVANFGVFDPRSGRVTARGVEPLRLEKGLRLSRCEGLSLDTLMLAVARPPDPTNPEAGNASWFLVPRDARVKVFDPADPDREHGGTNYSAARPLGGYHVCRQPTWTSALLEDVPLAGMSELLASGEWRALMPGGTSKGELDGSTTLKAGSPATLLDQRESWALVRAVVDGTPHTIAVPGKVVALPSGPAEGARELDGGLCPVARGVWRATAQNGQTFKVSQDTPGAELAGMWLEVPAGTTLLQLCQSGDPAGVCAPIYVGGAQSKETDRFVLVSFAGSYLAVRERDLRDRTGGVFDARRERAWYWRADDDTKKDTPSNWAFGLGPGARVSFLHQDDMAWFVRTRLQKLVREGVPGFEGGFGVGGDGNGVFLELTGGVGWKIYQFTDAPLELRASVLGKLDLRVENGGGLGFDVLGKAQLRWVNDFAPVSLELGLNFGYGGTFGTGSGAQTVKGRGGVTFGMPIGIIVELVEF